VPTVVFPCKSLLSIRALACASVQVLMLITVFLAATSFSEPARAITWVEHSPGCYKPLGRGGNCTFWDGFKPKSYDGQVSCLSPNLEIDDPRAICWWNRRIMGYYLFSNGQHPAAEQCVEASPSGWCNSLAANRAPGEGWNARYYRHKGITYYYLWKRNQCPIGWSESAGGECMPPTDNREVALNAGAPGCPAGSGGLGAGNPIHVGTGNKYQREQDLESIGPGGLRFVRHYNSRRVTRTQAPWRHNYQRELILKPFAYRRSEDGLLHGLHGTIQLLRPDGRTLVFYRTGEHELAASRAEVPDAIPAVGTNQYPLHWTGSEWRYRNESGDLEFYNETGQLRRIVDRQGVTQWVEHDSEGRVTEVRDEFGYTLTLEYESYEQQASRLRGPGGRIWHYGYDETGRLTTVTHPDGSTRTYHYGEFGAPSDYLTGITDENGNRYATWKYDDRGRAILSEHAGGAERTEIEYLSDGTTRVTDPSGSTRTYTLETIRGRMLASRIENGCSSCGDASDWEYNDLGLVTRKVDRNGNVTTYEYNEHGLETARTEAAGTPSARTITTEWDTDLRLPLVMTEPGLRTQYTYDGRGQRLSKTETDLATGESRTTTWSYHPDSPEGVPGQLAAIDGPRTGVDDVTTFDYDTRGNRIRTTNALGHVTELTDHDAYGRPLRLIDSNGLVTELAYDARGRLVSRNVGGEITLFDYDGVGNLTAIELPDGSELHYEYDAARRLVALADEEGNRIDYTLDAAGNRVEQNVRDDTGILARTQQQVFDEFDRLIRTIGARGQTTRHTYDDNGNRIGTTDPAGDATQRAFDALDRLAQVTDPLGGITAYEYDGRDRITAVTDPNGNTTRYTYNGFGDRIRVDSPDSGVTTHEFDAARNVIAKTNAKGQRTQYSYDALNRLIRTDYADGAVVEYVWDEDDHGIGRLARVEETTADGRSHRIEWTYDRHGRVTRRTQVVEGLALTTQHAYDAAGRRIETIYPSGRIVTYTYEADAVTGITVDGETVLGDAGYEPFGPVNGWTWGDGDVHSRTYDLDGRLTRHGLANGSAGGGTRTIDYTADDNIAAITGPRLSRTYGYDGLDRLVAANDPGRIDQYQYDANGNRTQRIEAGETETYTTETGSNRLLAVNGARNVEYSYDANGNLVDDGDHVYTYSARNRLVAVDGGNTAAYRYNALGQRIHKRAGGSDVDYAALAAEYQQMAQDLAADATALSEQAQATLDLANEKADQAERLKQEAHALREEADKHEQTAATLEEKAEQLRSEAQALIEQAEQKEAEATPLQEQAGALFAEAANLRAQAEAEWQAAQEDQQRADELAESAQARMAEAEAMEAQADENEHIAAENRGRAPELEAEAEALREQADRTEAEAQPYLEEVERLQRRIAPMQRTIDRFTARIARLEDRLIDNPRGWRQRWHNWRIQWRIRIQTWVSDWLQWRLDGWKQEQAEYQQQADALLAEATALRQQADQNDQLARQLREETDQLEAEATQLLQQAEEQRTLGEQKEAESADFAQQAQAHRATAEDLDGQAQAKEDEARPLADQAETLRAEAEALRRDANAKTAQADENEQAAQDLTQLAVDKRATADDKEQQAESLNAEAVGLYTEADALQTQAEEKQAEADTAQQKADEYAALADNPPAASQEQYFVYNDSGRLIGRYDDEGNAIREYFRMGHMPVAVADNDDVYYIHLDHLGTPRAVSEPNGAVVWTWTFDPFGDTEPNEDPDGDGEFFTLNLRFPGQYFDAETGIYYNWHRYYDPRSGRYETSDPIGLEGGLNTYGYSDNNPLRVVDPDGLYPRYCSGIGCLPIDWPDFPELPAQTKCRAGCFVIFFNPLPDRIIEHIAKGQFGSAGKGIAKKVNRIRAASDLGICLAECDTEFGSQCKSGSSQ